MTTRDASVDAETDAIITRALEDALVRATAAKRWSIVEQLSHELVERALARASALATQAGVVDLSTARRRRGRPAPAR